MNSYFTQAAKDRLAEIGIRHLRGVLASARNRIPEIKQFHQQLGIKYMLLATHLNSINGKSSGITVPDAHAAVLEIGPDLLDGIEGVNEPEYFDLERNIAIKAKNTIQYQQELYQTIKADPKTSKVKVFGPSISAGKVGVMDVAIGNIDPVIDGVNIHAYSHTIPLAPPPAPIGAFGNYPEDPNGTLLRALNAIKVMGSYSEPVLASETGYPTQPVNPPMPNPETGQAIYLPRLHLLLFNRGLWQVSSYAFKDYATGGADKQQNFGFLRSDDTPKPAFHSMKNLITLLKDPGNRFVPSPLNYTLSGNLTNVNETLLQKRDGIYYLALWIGKQLDLNNLTNAQVTLTFPQSMASIETAKPNNSVTWTAAGSGTTANITIDEKVTILKIVPETPQAPQACK